MSSKSTFTNSTARSYAVALYEISKENSATEKVESEMFNLQKLINENVFKLDKKNLFRDPEDQIIFLENIRFYDEEEKNDLDFSKHLAGLADLYVNDAFSCSHRAHASVCKITEFLPSFAGLQFETEINALKKVTSEIKKPITCIIGGSKISTKINVIISLIEKVNNLIIVGAMANNFLAFKNFKVGKSLVESDTKKIIEEIYKKGITVHHRKSFEPIKSLIHSK